MLFWSRFMNLKNKVLLSLIVHLIWAFLLVFSFICSLNPKSLMIFSVIWNETIVLSMLLCTFIVHLLISWVCNKKPLDDYDDEKKFKVINACFTMLVWLPLLFLIYGGLCVFVVLALFLIIILKLIK